MKLELIDNCIFDFDHTLIDTDKAFTAYWQTFREQLNAQSGLAQTEIDKALEETRARLQSQFFAGRIDLIKGSVGKALTQKLSEDEQKKILGAVRKSYHACLRPAEETVTMLDLLLKAKKALFIFTGGSPVHTKEKLHASGLWKYFRCVFTGDWHAFEDSAKSKIIDSDVLDNFSDKLAPVISLGPNPKSSSHGYEMLVAQANLDSSRSLMTGNHLSDDILNAQRAGLFAALATWYKQENLQDVVPNTVLTNQSDL